MPDMRARHSWRFGSAHGSGLSVLWCPQIPAPSMVPKPSNPTPTKMNIGEIIIAAVIRAAAIERAEHPTQDSTIFVWAANAEEQIEAALNEAGYTLCQNSDYPHQKGE